MGTFFNGECNEGRDFFYTFSEVWLCWDLTEKKFVALKVVKSASHYTGDRDPNIKSPYRRGRGLEPSSDPGSYFHSIFAQKPPWTR